MIKVIKLLVVIAAALVVLGIVLGCAAAFLSGGTDNNYEEHSFTSDSNVAHVYVDIHSDNIFVGQGDTDKVTVSYSDTPSKPYTVEQLGEDLYIRRRKLPWYLDLGNWFPFGAREHDCTIMLPRDFSGTLSLESSAGSIKLSGFNCSTLSAVSSSGSIRVDNINCVNKITAEASSGSIKLANIVCGDLNVQASSGSIGLDNIDCGGSIIADCSSGSIKGGNIEADDVFSGATTSGSVRIDGVTAQRIRSGSSSGSVNIYGIDAQIIDLSSHSGSVRGSVIDGIENYKIYSDTGSGGSNLSSGDHGGDKTLTVLTSSGSIHFDFDENDG